MRLAEVAHIRQGLIMAGRGAGARRGDWPVRVVESADIQDDRLVSDSVREVKLRRSGRTLAHLLVPYDILVTARSRTIKVALVPPSASHTVAGATLLVVSTPDAGNGLAHFLWYFLTSTRVRTALASKLTATALPTLSTRALGEVPVVVPPVAELHRMAKLVDAAADSRDAALEAVRVRHDVVRDAVIAAIGGAE